MEPRIPTWMEREGSSSPSSTARLNGVPWVCFWPKRAPMRKVPPVSKGAPTMAASAFSRSWTFGRRMNVRTPEKRGVSKESAGSYRVMDLFSCRASDAQLGGQRLEVGHHEIRLGVGRRGRPGPFLAGAPVHPHGGEPQLPGGHDVVE